MRGSSEGLVVIREGSPLPTRAGPVSSRGKHVGDNARDDFPAAPPGPGVRGRSRTGPGVHLRPAGPEHRSDPGGTAAARHAGPLPPAGGRRRCQRGRLGQLVPVAAAPGSPGRPGVPGAPGAVSLRTYCSATGPRWAERTTTVSGTDGDLIQSTAIWVAVSADGRPVPLDESFQRVYGPSTGGRQVSARLTHPGLPESAKGRPWPLRAADFDTAGHVNNAVHWAAVEDELAGLDWLPGRAELEYHRPILPGAEPELVTAREPGELRAWLREGQQRLASAWLTAAGP